MRASLLHGGVPLVLCGMTFAMGGSGPVRPYRLPPDLLEYFKSRYGAETVTGFDSTIVETADGPRGTLSVQFGSGLPHAPVAEERADAMGRAMLQKEAALLDIPDMAEIRKKGFKQGDGLAVTHYERSIAGIRLFGANYSVHLNTEATVASLGATLVPTPLLLYIAAERDTIPEDKARAITGEQIRKLESAQVNGLERIAQPDPPYILWEAHGRAGPRIHAVNWYLTFDAFTGKIEKRYCNASALHVRAPTREEAERYAAICRPFTEGVKLKIDG